MLRDDENGVEGDGDENEVRERRRRRAKLGSSAGGGFVERGVGFGRK